MLYFDGEDRPVDDEAKEAEKAALWPSARWHVIFSRILVVSRSVYIKYNFASFNSAEQVPEHRESYEAIFATYELPKKHRFGKFPGPALFSLDAIFDSGLCDSELHGVGPLGTQDMFILTDFMYMLPVCCAASWNIETLTLDYGLLPPNVVFAEEAGGPNS